MKKLLLVVMMALAGVGVMRGAAAEHDCSICLETVNNIVEPVRTTLLCHNTHQFHTDCLVDLPDDQRQCPMCRALFNPAQIEAIRENWMNAHGHGMGPYQTYRTATDIVAGVIAAGWLYYGGTALFNESSPSYKPEQVATGALQSASAKLWMHYKALASLVGYVCGGCVIGAGYQYNVIVQQLAYEQSRFDKKMQDPVFAAKAHTEHQAKLNKTRLMQAETVSRASLLIGHAVVTYGAFALTRKAARAVFVPNMPNIPAADLPPLLRPRP